ncbi:MAG: hypothetical protein MJ200_02990 [Mycoplasmoidaceae bacterium]|nr:hypothetical protein [Mycoplasmoidaceae bacterium]
MKNKLMKFILPAIGLTAIVGPATILSSCNNGKEPGPTPEPTINVEFDGESEQVQAQLISEEKTEENYNMYFSSHYALDVAGVSVKTDGEYKKLEDGAYDFDEEEDSIPGQFK